MELTAAEVWSLILDEAKATLPEQAYRTWLAPTEAVAFSEDTLIIATPNPFAADWVEDKYADLLSALSDKVFGRRLRLSVKHDGGAKLSQQLPLPMRLESPPPPTIQRVQQRSAHAGPGNGSP